MKKLSNKSMMEWLDAVHQVHKFADKFCKNEITTAMLLSSAAISAQGRSSWIDLQEHIADGADAHV